MRIWHVDEDPRPAALELKGLGMAGQADLSRRLAGRRVDQGEHAVAVADHHAAGLGVEADVVGIGAELDGLERREFGALEAMDRSIAAVGDEDRIGGGIIGNALRLIELADPAQHFACSKIHDAQAIVAELGDEQSLAGEVDREMIDAAPDLAERNLLLQNQRLRRPGSGGPPQACAQEPGEDKSHDGQLTTAVQSVHVCLARCGLLMTKRGSVERMQRSRGALPALALRRRPLALSSLRRSSGQAPHADHERASARRHWPRSA